MSPYRVFIVDDEPANLESLERIIKSDGAKVLCFRDAAEALLAMRSQSIDILITDLRMGSLDGLSLLEAAKRLDPSVEVIMVTAYGTVEIAVEAIRKGAYDFITKPLQRVQVLKALQKAGERRRLVNENLFLREQLNIPSDGEKRPLIGKSQAVRQMLEVSQQAAHSRANVLIEGESGTGKGLLAEYLHRNGHSAVQGVFVKINCTAIPENLLEAELFGYEPGAFTGAIRRKKGRIELAEQGTLFLDEIGIAPLTFQTKLLRFLQEGEFERLGSNETLKVETRIISATNSNLKSAIEKGQLREDLYYRLNVIHIRVPPLRERIEDIPLLATKFLEESAKKNGRSIPLLDFDALECLQSYPWPGNIRELQNLMERSVVLNRSGKIGREDLPPEIGGSKRAQSFSIPFGIPLRRVETIVMSETLRVTKGDKKLAAHILGVHPRTVYRFVETLAKPAPGEEITDLQEAVV